MGVCLIRVVKTTVPNRNAEHKLGAGSRTALAGLPHFRRMIEKDVKLYWSNTQFLAFGKIISINLIHLQTCLMEFCN